MDNATPTPSVGAKDTPADKSSRSLSFFDLPAELRNKIYDLAAEDIKADRYRSCRFQPLTQVCRQIRAEYLPRYYSDMHVVVSNCYAWSWEISNLEWRQGRGFLRSWLSVFGDSRVPVIRKGHIYSMFLEIRFDLTQKNIVVDVDEIGDVDWPYSEEYRDQLNSVELPVARDECEALLVAGVSRAADGSAYMTKDVFIDLVRCVSKNEKRIKQTMWKGWW